ncbi:MAG TPA: DMT family transporter [Dongiaceae bacterium]|nr:DMT family transporter [Dongiaceae bacterium]
MASITSGAGLRNRPGRAIAYMLAASFLIIVLDTAVKWLAKGYSPLQIGFVRYVTGLLVAAGIATRAGGIRTLRTRRPAGHLLRSAVNLTTMLTFYYALRRLPLADAIAISFAAPLFATSLAGPMLGERVGPRRWIAVAVGFLGILLVVQPSLGGISLGAALALLSALCWALTMITSRQISTTESSHTILFYYSLAVVVALGLAMPSLWIEPTPRDWLWFLVAGLAGSFGQFCYNQAFRYGEASLTSPFDYFGMVWATIFGLVIFGDVPSWLVLAGAACIIASGVYIARREALLAHQGRKAAR